MIPQSWTQLSIGDDLIRTAELQDLVAGGHDQSEDDAGMHAGHDRAHGAAGAGGPPA